MTPGPSLRRTREAPELEPHLVPVRALLAEGNYRAALEACERLRATGVDAPVLLRLQGKAAEGTGDLARALELARAAVGLRPRNVRARLRLARCLWRNGEPAEALAVAESIEATARTRPGALLRVAEFHSALGRPKAAYRCRKRALTLRPGDAETLGAMAESAAAMGRIDEAERYYDQALYQDPAQVLWLERRSRLRRGGESDRQAAQLGYALDALEWDDPKRAPVCFALARELDALTHCEPAFGIWAEGARCRLLALKEDPDRDRVMLDRIATVFDEQWLRKDSDRPDTGGSRLVFVTGLPESGLEAIGDLFESANPVTVLREPGFLLDAVTRQLGSRGDWLERLLAASTLDLSTLAAAYEQTAQQLSQPSRRIVDVSTAHVWVLGLLVRAFPEARVVHLRRDPLDHCLALFTTLFSKGHAWSYDLDALARYYGTYHRLMGHWRRHLAENFLDLDYELLFQDPQTATERLHQFLALAGSERPETSMIPGGDGDGDGRGPGINGSSHYKRELAVLAQRLRDDGVPVD